MKKIFIPLVLLSVVLYGASCKGTGTLAGRSNVADTPGSTSGVEDGSGILDMYEVDAGGKKVLMTEGQRIVDPNSEIHISINRKKLSALIAARVPEDSALTARLSKFRDALQSEQQYIKTLGVAIDLYNKSSDKSDTAWQRKMANLGPIVYMLIEDEEANAIYNVLPDIANENPITGDYLKIFRAFSILVDRIEAEMLEQNKKKGYYVRLGAWLQDKNNAVPIHIDGFDSYTPNSPYTVEQFNIVLSDEQQKLLTEIANLADKANKEGLAEAMKTMVSMNGIIRAIASLPSYQKAKEVETALSGLVAVSQQEAEAFRQSLERIKTKLVVYKVYMDAKLEKYKNQVPDQNPGNALLQINADVREMLDRTNQLVTVLKTETAALQSQILTAGVAIRAQAQMVVQQVDAFGDSLKTDIQVASDRVREAAGLFSGANDFRSNAYDFTEKVNKLTLDKIPDRALINLEFAGKRDVGDKLVIKFSYGNENQQEHVLYSGNYHLYFCTPYVRTAVGFLFVDPAPLFKKEDNKSLFYYAPSYSILLKGLFLSSEKTRRKLSYHKIYSPGVGINIATLDFNSDGSMEIGVGGVVTIFNDFIQLGYGVNTYDGKGYSFFGFKIPIGAFSLR